MSESELMEVEESIESEAESETSSLYSGPIGPALPPCDCLGRQCATKNTAKRKGCKCRDDGRKCSDYCLCSHNNPAKKPCKNRVQGGQVIKRKAPEYKSNNAGPSNESLTKDEEDSMENQRVHEYVQSLDIETLKLLVIRCYQSGNGSMEHIKAVVAQIHDQADLNNQPAAQNIRDELDNYDAENNSKPVNQLKWCICGNCTEMPQEIENKCCRRRDCITRRRKFTKFCLDPENLEMCIRNATDIRNDARDSSTRSFRKAAYSCRQYTLWQHGYLGKGNRRVVPSCCVLKIRTHYPSPTGVYMGYHEH